MTQQTRPTMHTNYPKRVDKLVVYYKTEDGFKFCYEGEQTLVRYEGFDTSAAFLMEEFSDGIYMVIVNDQHKFGYEKVGLEGTIWEIE